MMNAIVANDIALVDDVCDYMIARLTEAGVYLNLLKLQKLAYYVQAWSNAFFKVPCFDSSFEAWVHGPVSPPLYRRFREMKSLYSAVTIDDVRPNFNADAIPASVRLHINNILEAYGQFSDDQLEEMTHLEEPWISARRGYKSHERCNVQISDTSMEQFYAKRMTDASA